MTFSYDMLTAEPAARIVGIEINVCRKRIGHSGLKMIMKL